MSKNTWFPWPSAVCRCRLFDSFKLKVKSYHGVVFLFGKVKLTFYFFFQLGVTSQCHDDFFLMRYPIGWASIVDGR